MLMPSIGFCLMPSTTCGALTPVASRIVGTMSMMWWNWWRMPPGSLMWPGLEIASHFGGTRQGLAISWPGHLNDPGGIRQGRANDWPGHINAPGGIRHQFHHIIDIVPTILEATGVRRRRLSTAS